MAVRRLTTHLEKLGFKKCAHPCHYPHYFTSGSKGVVLDCMKVRSYRFFLGLDCIPANYPSVASIQQRQIDAESPWFRYRRPEEKEEAITACIRWLDEVGLPFLAAPFSKELYRWVTDEKILIRDTGVIIPIPRMMRLP